MKTKFSASSRVVARFRSTLMAAGLAVLASTGLAHAQSDYPNKPIKLIIPFSPGGATDIIGRLVANRLSEVIGQPVVVENRGGAASVIGTDAGSKAAPDGYTLVITNGAAITIAPLLGKQLPYDPVNDFEHIFLLGTFPNGLLVNVNHPAKDLKQFVELAGKSTAGFNYGSAGVGSAGFLTGEMLKQKADFKMTHVPYKGTGPAMNDLIGGQLDAIFNNMQAAKTQSDAGNVRVLAVSGPKRMPQFPGVPTMDEIIPGTIGEAWFGVSGPKGIPPEVIKKIETALDETIRDETIRKQLGDVGMTPVGAPHTEFVDFLGKETEKWAPIIKAADIKIE